MAPSFYDAGSANLVIRFARSDDPNGERRDWGVLMRDLGSGTPLSAELREPSTLLQTSMLTAAAYSRKRNPTAPTTSPTPPARSASFGPGPAIEIDLRL